MNILLVAATPFEIAPTLRWLEQHFTADEANVFSQRHVQVKPLITGVGPVATTWALARHLGSDAPGLALNAGVAGAFDRRLSLGEVVQVVSERFGDLGVEEADGRLTDLFELGLAEANGPPFINGVLHNPAGSEAGFLPAVRGLTVSRVHGSEASIATIQAKYPDVQVETMEGAAFFQACLLSGIPFLQIRGLSNYVEPRNRAAWQLEAAIENLNQVLIEMLQAFAEP